jgi:DinB family protein/SCP-2 sterol transfer family protein
MQNDVSQNLADLETIWSALDSFYQNFAPQDWARRHGKDWTFADMPFHLAYFNQMVVNNIGNDSGQRAKFTLQELNAWNDAHFAERPASQAGARGLEYLHETQATLKQAATQHLPETPVFMPLIIVGGWRTLKFALEYLLAHTWLHFTESHLRYNQSLPNLPASLVHNVLDFNMEMAGGALQPSDLAGVNLATVLHLTGPGGGSWTFTMRDGKYQVEKTASTLANAEITTDIATYMKTSTYNMQSPIMALLTGKTRIKGMVSSQQFQKIFAITPSRIWNFADRGKTTSGQTE